MSEENGTAEVAAEPTAGRGRPRPDETVARDKQVLEHLATNGPKTRKQLVEELETPGNTVYLSLYRLSRQDPPAVVKNGAQWSVPGAVAAPAAEASVTVE